jgi:hypothetical protein
MINLHGKPFIDQSRTVYVLIHKDHTHVASLPDGSADWSYNRADMELREKILSKDFANRAYSTTTLPEAITLICNKQDELEQLWKPALKEIFSATSIQNAFAAYKRARRKIGPHPIRFDAQLKKKLDLL